MFIFFQTKKKQTADQSLFEKKYWVAMQKSYSCMHTNKLANFTLNNLPKFWTDYTVVYL